MIDPFVSIDGVKDLVKIAVEKGKNKIKRLNWEFVENTVEIRKVLNFAQKLV